MRDSPTKQPTDRQTDKPGHGRVALTGFPIKDARFSKLKNIPFLLSDEKEVKIIENIEFKYFSNRALGNPVQ